MSRDNDSYFESLVDRELEDRYKEAKQSTKSSFQKMRDLIKYMDDSERKTK